MTALDSATSWLDPDSAHDALVMTGLAPGLIEGFVRGKHPNRPSEDVLVVTRDFVAVLDGLSSPLRCGDQPASGRAYAMAVARAITSLPPSTTAQGAIAQITAALSDLTAEHSGPAGAVAAICSLGAREVWRVGDVHLRINERTYLGSKRVDHVMAGFRAAVNHGLLNEGTSPAQIRRDDPGLAAATPLLEVQPTFANQSGVFGYGVLNGQPVPAAHIEVFALDVGDEVVMASDGFLGPRDTLAEAQDELTRLMREDPLALGPLWEMAKPLAEGAEAPDDRTYVRIRPEESR